MLKIVSWNIARRQAAWAQLLEVDADLALIQEGIWRQPELGGVVDCGPQLDESVRSLYNRWPLAVKLSFLVVVLFEGGHQFVDGFKGSGHIASGSGVGDGFIKIAGNLGFELGVSFRLVLSRPLQLQVNKGTDSQASLLG